MSQDEKQSARPRGHLEREETKLWRLALLFLVLLATGLAALSWERLENLPYHLGVIPVGLLVMAILFATYAYGRRREVSELKHLLQNLQERAGATPSEEQLDQLSQVILRSQRSFKELIDSIDDIAFAVSLDGTLRTVNRRTAGRSASGWGTPIIRFGPPSRMMGRESRRRSCLTSSIPSTPQNVLGGGRDSA